MHGNDIFCAIFSENSLIVAGGFAQASKIGSKEGSSIEANSMVDERSIWLSALLHDIGKVAEMAIPASDVPSEWRASARYGHEAYSARVVQTEARPWAGDLQAVTQMVLRHHDAQLPDETIVQLADWLASYEREEAEAGEPTGAGKAQTALCSVLSRVQREPTPRTLYYPLRPLELHRDSLFPQPDYRASGQAYQQLWQGLARELHRVPSPHPRTLQALLHKYLWTVPSDRSYEVVPDVSLYSHLVSAAAIAVCLARLDEQEILSLRDALKALYNAGSVANLPPSQQQALRQPIAVLIKGDISGTQDFLYLLSSQGAARGLRGRSFYLQLLTETIAWWILRQLDLPFTNRLYVGGGHFYLLAPYSTTTARWQGIQQQVTEKLWLAHQADLSLNLEMVEVCALDFISRAQGGNGFAPKWEEVSQKVQAAKQQRWRAMGTDAMMERLFTPHPAGTTAEEMCQVCYGEWQPGVDKTDQGVRKCRRCFAFEELGKQLRDPEYLVHFLMPDQPLPSHPTWRDILRSFGVDVHILLAGLTVSPPQNAEEAVVERVDNTDFLSNEALQLAAGWQIPTGFDWRLLADATPVRDDHPEVVADFDHLAGTARGVKWLGVLRMDVDDLGDLFHHGLGDRATLSRMATLSESLRLYFEAWVPMLCRAHNQHYAQPDKQGKVYLLYAGGDDLFLVGAWSALPILAEAIRNDFRAYAGGDHVTLSAGIAIEHEKYPLYRLADEAKAALDDRAKSHTCLHGRKKDSICYLQEPLCWQEFGNVRDWKDRLIDMLEAQGNARVPRSLLQRLMEISLLYRTNSAQVRREYLAGRITEQQMRDRIAHDRWRWRMMYHLSRFIQRYQSQQQNLQALLSAMQQQNLIANVHVAARWAELLTREGK